MNRQNDAIKEELTQAGQPTPLTPEQNALEQLRITPEKQLKPMDFLFRLFGKSCFPRGELVGITGKAKSGKTFLSTMLMTCSVVPDVLSFHREQEEPLRVLWYDTEQSDESTQDIMKHRLMPMTGGDISQIDVFNVRSLSWKKRRKLLGTAVSSCSPDLVIVDGIRDLVNDINDGTLAQEVMEELMQLAAKHGCCITCILHQNKGSEDHNLRGWIGTELMNKAFEVYACEKILPDRIFAVEQTLTRKYDIERTLYFKVNDEGLPVLSQEAQTTGGSASQKQLPALNAEYIRRDEDGNWSFNIRKLFNDALQGDDEVTGSMLRERVMKLSGIAVPFKYNQLLTQALEEKVIEKHEKNRLTYYGAAPF